MLRNKKGFTLIELIIVIVIIGILAIISMPKYFANIDKARKAEALATLGSMRDAVIGYYAATTSYPPNKTTKGQNITVNMDGTDIMSVTLPDSKNFTYSYTTAADGGTVNATNVIGAGTKSYGINITTGAQTEY